MKQTKQDVKYIIKRILIGVGIAVVLFNLKKCNVYALDRYSYVLPQRSGVIQLYNTEQNSIYIPNVGTKATINNLNVVDSSFADDTTIHFGTDSTTGTYSASATTLLHFIYNQEFEVFFQILLNPSSTTYTKLSSNDYSLLLVNDGSIINGSSDYLQIYLVPTADIDKPLSQISDKTKITSSTNITYISMDSALSSSHCPLPNVSNVCSNVYTATSTDANGDTIYFGNQVATGSNINENLLDSSKIVILENKNNWFAYNGETLEPEPLDPVLSYTEVDITGYQAILITPKSYLQLANLDGNYIYNEDTDQHYILYKYAYQRCIRPTYINITNVKDFYTADSWVQGFMDDPYDSARRCATEPTIVEESIIYTSPEMQASDTPYNYYGILLYNDSIEYNIEDENWINNQVNPYGANSVWIDTSLYNYYLVSSFSNFNQDISYIDAEGNEQTTHVDSLPTFNDMIDASINNWEDNSMALNSTRIETFLSFIKLPFTFLRSLKTDACVPISIPFPRSNTTITLPCVKQLISDKLGTNFLNIIQIIINGLIIYRCTLSNIKTLREGLDPTDDKLEVLEL